MKKLVFVLFLIPLFGTAQVDYQTKVYANHCGWANSYLEFESGDKITITASGGWKSNGEDFTYHGASNGHRDPRAWEPEIAVMTLLIKIQDGAYSTIEHFNGKDRIVYTFQTNNGRIYFACNDDLKNAAHCGDNEGYVTAKIIKN